MTFKKLAIVAALIATMTGCASAPRQQPVNYEQLRSQPKKTTEYWGAHLLAPQSWEFKDVCGFRTPERMSQHYQKSVTVHDKIIDPIARARGLALNDNRQFLLEEDAYMRKNYPEFWRHSGKWNSNVSEVKLANRHAYLSIGREPLFVSDDKNSWKNDPRTPIFDKNIFYHFIKNRDGSGKWATVTLDKVWSYKINARLYDRSFMPTTISHEVKGRIPTPFLLYRYVSNTPDPRWQSPKGTPVFVTLNWNEDSGKQIAADYQRVTGYYPPGAQYLSESPNAAPHHTGMVNVISGGAPETAAVFATPREYYRCPAEFVNYLGHVMKNSEPVSVGKQKAESLMNCLMGKGKCMATVDTRQVR